jgi:hypothetical protein
LIKLSAERQHFLYVFAKLPQKPLNLQRCVFKLTSKKKQLNFKTVSKEVRKRWAEKEEGMIKSQKYNGIIKL